MPMNSSVRRFDWLRCADIHVSSILFEVEEESSEGRVSLGPVRMESKWECLKDEGAS